MKSLTVSYNNKLGPQTIMEEEKEMKGPVE